MPAMRAVFLSDVMAASSLPGMLHGSTRAWHGEVVSQPAAILKLPQILLM